MATDTYISNLRKMAQALTELTKPRHLDYHSRPLDDYDNDMSASEIEEYEDEPCEGPDPVDAQYETDMELERRVGW